MQELTYISIINALLIVFTFVIMSKYGVFDLWDTYKPKQFGSRCYFCWAFWLNCIILIIEFQFSAHPLLAFTAPSIVYLTYNEK